MLNRLLVIFSTALGLLVFLELIFRVLPVSTSTETGYYLDADILNYPAGHEWVMSTGWDLRNSQRLRANNLGFAAHRDFIANSRAIALIGDSFVESSMLAERERPGYQLESALGGRPVYPMGGPGSSLLDYANRIRFAKDRLQVRDMVVFLEPGDLRQAICGSGNVHSACLAPGTLAPREERQLPASWLKRAFRHSAVAQYLASQLKVQPQQALTALAKLSSSKATPRKGPSVLAPAEIQIVLKEFFGRLGSAQTYGRMLFVVDGQHDQSDPPLTLELQAERVAFIEAARQWGAVVLDAEEAYRRHRVASIRSVNVGPYDRHLNALGVRILFGAVAGQLKDAP